MAHPAVEQLHDLPREPDRIRAARRTSSGEPQWVANGAAMLAKLAGELPAGHIALAAVCDDAGLTTDVLVRDGDGNMRATLGLPESIRPSLAELLAVALGDPTEKAALHAGELPAAPGAPVYRAIVEQGPVAVAVIDPADGGIRYASPVWLEMLGYEPGELRGRHAFSFVHEEDRQAARSALAHLRDEAAAPVATWIRARHRSGGYVWLDIAASPTRDPINGLDVGLVVAARNITASRMVLDRLLARDRRLRALAHAAEHGAAIVSVDGYLLAGNRTLARTVGSAAEQLEGKHLTGLFGSEVEPVLEALRLVATDRRERQLELVARTQAVAEPRHLQFRISSDSATGAGEHLMLLVHDATDERSIMDEAGQVIDRLRRENRELEEFGRVVSHDLAAPLRALEGMMDLLGSRGESDPMFIEIYQAMRRSLSRMRTMVDGALDFTTGSRVDIRGTQVELDGVLQWVLESLADDIAERDAVVDVDPLPVVHADEQQMQRLFVNLIKNALRYSGEAPPVVHVSARREASGWLISVADEGVGVAAADRERIFDLFARGPGAQPGGGHGIGLATCRRIAELHGGAIWVEANEPRGSTFQVMLPH
jgi:PAS domain S-box-containing protein